MSSIFILTSVITKSQHFSPTWTRKCFFPCHVPKPRSNYSGSLKISVTTVRHIFFGGKGWGATVGVSVCLLWSAGCVKKIGLCRGTKSFGLGQNIFRPGLKAFRPGIKSFCSGVSIFSPGLKSIDSVKFHAWYANPNTNLWNFVTNILLLDKLPPMIKAVCVKKIGLCRRTKSFGPGRNKFFGPGQMILSPLHRRFGGRSPNLYFIAELKPLTNMKKVTAVTFDVGWKIESNRGVIGTRNLESGFESESKSTLFFLESKSRSGFPALNLIWIRIQLKRPWIKIWIRIRTSLIWIGCSSFR